jgi:hypothetical protein
MLARLPQNAAVPSPHHQQSFGIRVRHQRHVGDDLVVNKLIALGKLYDPVQGEHLAEPEALEYIYLLIFGPAGKDFLFYPEGIFFASPDAGKSGFHKPFFFLSGDGFHFIVLFSAI